MASCVWSVFWCLHRESPSDGYQHFTNEGFSTSQKDAEWHFSCGSCEEISIPSPREITRWSCSCWFFRCLSLQSTPLTLLIRPPSTYFLIQVITKEVSIWAPLKHENILPFFGFIIEEDSGPALITPWMENGNVIEFLTNNINADRLKMVHTYICVVCDGNSTDFPTKAIGIACGLGYLHENGIVHPDLKGVSTLFCQ